MQHHCKYCGAPIEWDRSASGKTIPYNPDGTRHHATCREWHRVERENRLRRARETRELRAAYGPAVAVPENPNQMHFSF